MAQLTDSLVLTPSGYLMLDEVIAGTKIITKYGDVSTVTDVFVDEHESNVYKITLNDGSCYRTHGNHLNSVYSIENNERRDYVLDTLELSDAIKTSLDRKFYIDKVTINNLEGCDKFTIDPQLLGILCRTMVNVDSDKETIDVRLPRKFNALILANLLKPYNCVLAVTPTRIRSPHYNRMYTICEKRVATEPSSMIELIERLHESTHSLPISDKIKPRLSWNLVYQSYEYRDRFVQGYLECGIGRKDQVIYQDNQLDSARFGNIVRSLGMVDKIMVMQPDPRRWGWVYVHDVDISNTESRYIVSVEPDGVGLCKRIITDSIDHSYITDHFIPTHN